LVEGEDDDDDDEETLALVGDDGCGISSHSIEGRGADSDAFFVPPSVISVLSIPSFTFSVSNLWAIFSSLEIRFSNVVKKVETEDATESLFNDEMKVGERWALRVW
jgi:hypothetical protein